MIPRILHFTWKTEELPREMRHYFEAFGRINPDWERRLWTDATMRDFVAAEYPEFLAVYDGYPKPIQRADAFRYLVLNRLGGIYADLDVEPLKSLEPLRRFPAFLGVEPLEHIAEDRWHQGVPVLFTNAFMGSEPSHPLWDRIIRLMPELAGQETFYSTGPSMVTAATLRLDPVQRPALLLPEVWSPLLSNGVRGRSDGRLAPLLAGLGEVIGAEGQGAIVSHKWHTTWVPWHKRQSRFSGLFQWPTALKWGVRRLRHPALAKAAIRDPAMPYFDQVPRPFENRPVVHVAVLSPDGAIPVVLQQALGGLSYPADRLRITGFARADAAALNRALVAAAQGADHVLLVDSRIESVPADALLRMLAARRDIVAANAVDAGGRPADRAVFRYKDGAPFRILYKDGASGGLVRGDGAFRRHLSDQSVFAMLPLDGVGTSFVLFSAAALAAGVRYAETPYKFHVGAEAVGIQARDLGFEAAGLPGLRVVKGG